MTSTTGGLCGCGKTTGLRRSSRSITIIGHANPLVRRFIEIMNRERATFADVAIRSNLGIDTMRFWQTRHVPRLDTFEAALNALGYELHIRPMHGPRHGDLEPQTVCGDAPEMASGAP